MKVQNICVLGGGGFVGSHLVPLLAARGHRLRLAARRRERCKHLLPLPGVEVEEADSHDPASLRTLFTGMDAVINLVGILHERKPGDFERVHVELPGKAIAAAQAVGVGRFLQMSALGAAPGSPSRYQQSKAAGEALFRDLPGATVFRPSVIFGPGDSFLTLFADLIRLAPVIPLADAGARFQPVYVGDVARAFADSLARDDTRGRGYDLCGPKVYSLAELVELSAATLGLRRRVLPLNSTASYWFARLLELKPGAKIMTRDNHYAMRNDNVCPANHDQAFGPPTALEGVVGYLKEAGPRRRYDAFRAHAGR